MTDSESEATTSSPQKAKKPRKSSLSSIEKSSPTKESKEDRLKDCYELPLSKVRGIMRTAPDVHNIGEEGLFAMAKAAELFIAKLAQGAYEHSKGHQVKYNDLASYVSNTSDLEYMHDILPKMVKYRDVKHLVEQQIEKDKRNKS